MERQPSWMYPGTESWNICKFFFKGKVISYLARLVGPQIIKLQTFPRPYFTFASTILENSFEILYLLVSVSNVDWSHDPFHCLPVTVSVSHEYHLGSCRVRIQFLCSRLSSIFDSFIFVYIQQQNIKFHEQVINIWLIALFFQSPPPFICVCVFVCGMNSY